MAIHTPVRGLRSFCVAAKTLSFKKTANQLFLTPSAVSHQVRQLEEQLGFPLFKRITRSLELTERGYRFYSEINPLMSQLESTISRYKDRDSKVSISITLPEFFASEMLIPKLSEWSADYPNVNLILDTIKAPREMHHNGDLSIVLTNSKPNAQWCHELLSVSYVPACNHQVWMRLKSSGFAKMASVPLILHQARPNSWQQWAEYHDADISNNKIIQLDSMFSVARAAQRGLGLALIPLPISQTWFEQNLLYQFSDKELKTRDRYYLIQNDIHHDGAEITQFIKWLCAQFHEPQVTNLYTNFSHATG